MHGDVATQYLVSALALLQIAIPCNNSTSFTQCHNQAFNLIHVLPNFLERIVLPTWDPLFYPLLLFCNSVKVPNKWKKLLRGFEICFEIFPKFLVSRKIVRFVSCWSLPSYCYYRIWAFENHVKNGAEVFSIDFTTNSGNCGRLNVSKRSKTTRGGVRGSAQGARAPHNFKNCHIKMQ